MSTSALDGQFALDLRGLEKLRQDAAGDPQKHLRDAAEQFEALFLQKMLQSMRDATPHSGLVDNSSIRFYESMFDQQLSQHMAGEGLGLAEQLVAQLSDGTATDAN
ncbi:rod-binding protein [Microbulbifer litoralis]|uniref:rod-binding protein n=1 Tax=Microbulbifer litoralis TaxID=2933965 RepID=UPI0020281FAC|nr:rod-binding protein [Microbulbifer sp. GX H0434]